jgi:hypothetical protein
MDSQICQSDFDTTFIWWGEPEYPCPCCGAKTETVQQLADDGYYYLKQQQCLGCGALSDSSEFGCRSIEYENIKLVEG